MILLQTSTLLSSRVSSLGFALCILLVLFSSFVPTPVSAYPSKSSSAALARDNSTDIRDDLSSTCSCTSCYTDRITEYVQQSKECPTGCCDFTIRVATTDESLVSFLLLDSTNYASFSTGRPYSGFKSASTTCISAEQSFCAPDKSHNTLFYAVVKCDNLVNPCPVLMNIQISAKILGGTSAGVSNTIGALLPTILGIAFIVVCMVAFVALLWMLKKQKRCCWSPICTAKCGCCGKGDDHGEDFEAVPLDSLEDSHTDEVAEP
jgi:hypothetical protein